MTDKFTSAFDTLYKKDKDFAELIILNSLTRAAVSRSLIIPPKSVTKKIKGTSDKASRINHIMHYILRSKINKDKLAEMKGKKEAKLFTLRSGYFYPLETDGKSFKLNGVKLEVVKELFSTTLFKVAKELTPIKAVEKTGGSTKKRKTKKRKTKKRKKTAKKKGGATKKSKTESYSDLIFGLTVKDKID